MTEREELLEQIHIRYQRMGKLDPFVNWELGHIDCLRQEIWALEHKIRMLDAKEHNKPLPQ